MSRSMSHLVAASLFLVCSLAGPLHISQRTSSVVRNCLQYLLGKNVKHFQASYQHNVNSHILLEGLFLMPLIKCSPVAHPPKWGSLLALLEVGSLFLHCPLAGLLHWVLPSLAVVEARPCLVYCFVKGGQTCSRFNRYPLFNFTKAQYCFAPFKSTFLAISCWKNILKSCPLDLTVFSGMGRKIFYAWFPNGTHV